MGQTLLMVHFEHTPTTLTVRWPDGAEIALSAGWIRHSCACEACLHPSGQRLIDIASLAPDATIAAAHLDGTELVVDVDQHPVRLRLDALEPAQPGEVPTQRWASDPEWLRQTAVPGDADLTSMLTQVATHGIGLAVDVECAPGAVLEFARRCGFVRSTNYGDLFDVRSVADPNNLAFTSLGLPLHTDNPYRDPVPTVQILHCLQNSASGGVSMFADGFGAAEQLRTVDPAAFEVLRSTPVDFRFADAVTDLRATKPVIGVGVDGAIESVRLNNRSMQPVASPTSFYEALARFTEIVNDPACIAQIRLGPGDVVVFDNRRVLHARSAFQADGDRHLQGCYIDIDAIRSRALVANR